MNAPNPIPVEPIVTTQSLGGATLTTKYAGREVRVWAVLDTEVRELSSLNTTAAIYCSVASGLVSLALGIWISAMFSSQLTAEGRVACIALAPVLVVLGVVASFLARNALKRRHGILKDIEVNSKAEPNN